MQVQRLLRHGGSGLSSWLTERTCGAACGTAGTLFGPFVGLRRRAGRASSRRLLLEPLEQRQLLAAQPLITEFMASNQGSLDDGDGTSSDWIEIHNAGNEAIDLAGYRLTDDADQLDKWVLPSVQVEPGGFLVVFASGQETGNYVDSGGHLHTNFRLGADGEYLALVSPDGTVVSQYGGGTQEFPAQLTDVSYGIAQSLVVLESTSDASYLVPLSDLGMTWTEPSFDAAAAGFTAGKAAMGFEDRPNDRTNFAGEIQTVLPSATHAALTRMEFQLADASVISTMALRLKYDNGFVAYINGLKVAEASAPADLSWYATATDGSRRDSLALEQVEFDITQHVSALRDGTNVLAIHLLNYVSDNTDLLMVPELALGTSDMAAATGAPAPVGFMITPTPGAPNVKPSEVYSGFVQNPQISVEGGFYDQPFTVEVTTATPGATIRYTTDSSVPSETNGTVYAGPIAIEGTTVLRAAAFQPGFIPADVQTRTYIFLDGVLTQSGEGLPRTWGKMGNTENGKNASDPVPANYRMDRRVVNDARYRDTIKDDLQAIPTLSLVLDPDDLWSEENDGIYAYPLQEGAAWERPVSAELYGTDGQLEFQIDAGIRIHGGWGRRPSQTNKHSMRLLFKSEYGPSKLEYPWFGEDAAQEFDTIVLRANFNHSWAAGGDTLTSFVQDPWAAQTQLDMGWVASHGTFVHLYLNGLYWGMYNPVERPTNTFAAEYFGGDKDEYDVIAIGTATNGDSREWTNLTRLVSAREVDYEAVQEVLDIDAFIDYLIINQYGANWDWPQNNWYATRRRVDGAKWYFHCWDAEGMFRGVSESRVNEYGGMGVIYQHLRNKVEEFRVRFADRVQKHLFNDGLMTPEANTARLNRLAAQIDRAVVGESARWGDSRWDDVSPPRTRDDHWLPRIESLREDYFPRRGDILLKQYRQAGLYPEMDAPQLSRHGGPVQGGFELTITNPGGAGTLYYTLDGTDPRLPGGAVAPGAIVYDGSPLVVSDDMHVMARIHTEDEWSALTETDFLVGGLRITEVNYHPHDPNPLPGMNEPAGSGDQFEFVELANVSSQPVDMTGVQFATGIQFAFPDGMMLAPGQRVVVVKDPQAFTARYGTASTIAGQYTGDLADYGELVELQDGSGRVLVRLSYQAEGAWPERAGGLGSSLEMIDPFGSYLDAANWRASSEYGGSPGSAGVTTAAGVVISEIVGHGNSPESDVLELHNTTGHAIDIAGWYLGNLQSDAFRLQLAGPKVLPPLGYVTLSEAELGMAFNIAQGDSVSLIQLAADGRPVRIADEVHIQPSVAGMAIGPGPDPSGSWLPLTTATPGQKNASPRVGEVIISEIQFNPLDLDGAGNLNADSFEFIELYNTTDQAIDLKDWRLSGENDFTALEFAAGTRIEPHQALAVVPFRTTSASTANIFRFLYGMQPTDPVVGWYRTKLANDAGQTLRLERPSSDDDYYIYVDEVRYDVQSPWPVDSEGTGKSLARTSPEAYGRFPTSWIVAAPTPDAVAFIQRVAGDANDDGRFDAQDLGGILDQGLYDTGQPATWQQGDWTGDGVFDRRDIVAALQSGGYQPDGLAALTRPSSAPAAPERDGDRRLSLSGEQRSAASDPITKVDELFAAQAEVNGGIGDSWS